MDTLSLTKELVNILSYVGDDSDEQKIGQFIFRYLKKFPWLSVSKEKITDGRFNVVAVDKFPTKILVCGHIDTVEPRGKWTKPKVVSGKLYGLGSSDMKGTIAATLSAIEQLRQTKGVMWLFYIDEEYDFLGMKTFIRDYKKKIKPELIIGEGSDCKITNGCRGLIEIKFSITGKTGHASWPENGRNAIIGSQQLVKRLTETVEKYSDPVMGQSSFNLASINGGLNLGQSKELVTIGRQGNNIADYCEFNIDVRPSTARLRAKILIKVATMEATKSGFQVKCVTKHDKLGWLSPIKKLPKAIIKRYSVVSDYRTGYLDIQMLNETFRCSCFGFGAGLSSQAHQPNEFIPVKNLKKCTQFYCDLIRLLGGGDKND